MAIDYVDSDVYQNNDGIIFLERWLFMLSTVVNRLRWCSIFYISSLKYRDILLLIFPYTHIISTKEKGYDKKKFLQKVWM